MSRVNTSEKIMKHVAFVERKSVVVNQAEYLELNWNNCLENSTFMQNSEFRKHKKPKIQLFTFLNHQKAQNN